MFDSSRDRGNNYIILWELRDILPAKVKTNMFFAALDAAKFTKKFVKFETEALDYFDKRNSIVYAQKTFFYSQF